MRNYPIFPLIIFFLSVLSISINAEDNNIHIRLNQVGFLPADIKTAIVFSDEPVNDILFYIRETDYLEEKFCAPIIKSSVQIENFSYCYTLDFSSFNEPGSYIVEVDGYASFPFLISQTIFNSITDSLLLFFTVQRCGPTNPFLHLPCHLSDASEVIGDIDSPAIDVTGGWHDAGDYIKFLMTTAYTTYMLVFSYEFDEKKFGFDNNNNSVPDVLEEAKIGLDWLLRANYKNGKLITQVQDLRDHTTAWRMPEDDSLRYDRVAFSGMGKNQAGLFTAAMALAARVWKEKFKAFEFSEKCLQAAEDIYSLRNVIPDIDVSPSGAYQDKTFAGKMALGAAELYYTTLKKHYLSDALAYADSCIPDFWWSWGNLNALSYYRLAEYDTLNINRLRQNLDFFNSEKDKYLFNEGISYTWGTTNALLGISLQAILYKKITDEIKYDSIAVYQRDYILGRNKWGFSFISKIGSRFPVNIHSQIFYLNGGNLPGALVAGPAPGELLRESKIEKNESSHISKFNTSSSGYNDDYNDYITNEPSITSNATALFVFGCYSER